MIKKLREFRQGMDANEYLMTEFRQNIGSLNEALTFFDNSQFNEIDCFYFTKSGLSLNNSTTIVDISTGLAKTGSVSNSIYYPSTAGAFWVELSGYLQINNTGGESSVVICDSRQTQVDEGIILGRPTATLIYSSTNRGALVNISLGDGICFKAIANSLGTIKSLSIKIKKVG